jgi:cytochrome P450
MKIKPSSYTQNRIVDRASTPPTPDGQTGLRALRAMIQQKSPLAALTVFHQTLGDVFQINLPGFKPIVMVGPEANRFVLVTHRAELRWRSEQDPITKLLRQGLLVIDGEPHDTLRHVMTPAFHRRMLAVYVAAMWRYTDQISATWPENRPIDMLDQIRRMAMLILVGTMFRTDFTPKMERLWPAVLKSLSYISPGAWVIWPGIPRPGYAHALRQLDEYLYEIIRLRRASQQVCDDLLGLLVSTQGLSDDLIRDQLFTMLIAGHDTSTALLAWAVYLLGRHPDLAGRAQVEVDAVLGSNIPTLETISQLNYLEQVINETMRLYPPLHLGNRLAAVDVEFQGYHIPAGSRIMYSPFLSHRQPEYWPNPTQFDPERFGPEATKRRPAYTFVPFGGGPRICLGAAFAQVEAKVILARLLQGFNLTLIEPKVHLHMGVTLEPRPGVIMQVQRRPNQ